MNYLAILHKDLSLIRRNIFKTDPYLSKRFTGSVPLDPMMTNLIRGVLRLQVFAKGGLGIQSTVVNWGPDRTRSRGPRGSKHTTWLGSLTQRCSYLRYNVKRRITQVSGWSTNYLQCPKLPPPQFHIKVVLWLPKGHGETLNERVNALNERVGPSDLKSLESLELWFYI